MAESISRRRIHFPLRPTKQGVRLLRMIVFMMKLAC